MLVEIAFGEAVTAKFQLGWLDISEISVEDSEGIQLGDVMPTDLVSANEQLDLMTRKYDEKAMSAG